MDSPRKYGGGPERGEQKRVQRGVRETEIAEGTLSGLH